MSNWNSLESNLRQWTPRQPSPDIRTRLFRAPSPAVAAKPTRVRFTDFSQWLVPAFGCFLLVVGTLSSRVPAHQTFNGAQTNLVLSDSTSAYREVAIASRAIHSDINSLPAGRLEWTFGARSNRGAGAATLASYTNQIIH